jgi:hypothetical protein
MAPVYYMVGLIVADRAPPVAAVSDQIALSVRANFHSRLLRSQFEC